MPVVVTQLVVDASGAKTGVAEFEAAMGRAKQAAVDGGEATATSFERAQSRWTASLAKTDPVIKAQIAMERDLARQREIGANAVKLGIASQDAATAQLEKVRQQHVTYISTLQSTNVANENVAKSTGLASYQVTNLFRQLNDVATGLVSGQSPFMVAAQQTGQIVDVFQGGNVTAKGFFDQVKTGAASVLTPMRLVGASALAIGAAGLYIANNWSESSQEINRSLIGVGARTGETIQSIRKFSSDNSSLTGLSVTEARNVAVEFTKTGNIAASTLKGVGDAIHGYAVLTGKDATEATKVFAEALGAGAFNTADFIKGLEGIDKVYGVLDASTKEYIRTLDVAGQRSQAIQTYVDKISPANKAAADSVGYIAKAYGGLKNVLSDVFNYAGPETNTAQDTLNNAIRRRDEAASNSSNIGRNSRGELVQFDDPAQKLAALNKEVEDAQKALDGLSAKQAAAQLVELSKAADGVVRAITPQTDQIEKLESALAGLNAAQAKGVNLPGMDAAKTAIQNQIAGLQDAQGQAQRYNARVAEISTEWGNVGQSTALALEAAHNQLPVLEAVGGAARMAAQETADYKNYMDQGKTSTEAAALAASNLAAAQAQVNSSAREQLAALQDQAAVASARNPIEAAQGQAQATFNALLRQGVDTQLAMNVAAQQETNAREQIYQANQKSVKSSQQALDLARAQGTGAEALVKSQIAYDNAIDNGATSAQAAAISVNTLQTATIQAEKAAWDAAAAYEAMDRAVNNKGSFDFSPDPKLTNSTGVSVETIPYAYKKTLQDASIAPPTVTEIANKILAGGGNSVNSAISAIQGLSPGTVTTNPASQLEAWLGYQQGQLGLSKSTTISQSDIIGVMQQLVNAQNSQTSDKGQQAANLQQELGWLQKLPQSIDTLNAISSLKSSIESLTKSTDGLNSTNQDLLSPYYSQDPRTSHIGFRSQGMATGGEFTVPGGYSANDNMLAQIPVASGEIVSVRRPGQNLGGGTTQNNYNLGGVHITVMGPVTPEVQRALGRTVYQESQRAVRQLQAAGQ